MGLDDIASWSWWDDSFEFGCSCDCCHWRLADSVLCILLVDRQTEIIRTIIRH